MSLLTIDSLQKSYGERTIFADVSFNINAGEKVGVIGVNGTGKSTFLKIAAGIDEPDAGTVVRGNMLISYLPQEPSFDRTETVWQQVFRGNSEPMRLLGRYETLLSRSERNPADSTVAAELAGLAAKLTPEIWNLENEARTILTRLGITDFTVPVAELSGGQRKRVAMAGALLLPADLLILDEPTNHIDSDTVAWLEDYLADFRGALLMVTHDRYFLDRVTNRIVELDNGHLYSYDGNYSYFLEKKLQRDTIAAAAEDKRRNILRKELAWIRRGAQARSTKQKARIERFEELSAAETTAADQQVEIVAGSTRLGKKVIEIAGLEKHYGAETIVDKLDFLLLRHDRVGIIGPNGRGKTTFLDMLAGRIAPDAGRIEQGSTVKIGYFSQENEHMDPAMRVIDYIKEQAEVLAVGDGRYFSAAQMLEMFLFTPHMQWTPIARLSGGERRRLYLLRVLMGAPNVLLLDEPTNDLDIGTLTILEDYLDSFAGAVLAVSHDRYFLDRIARRILAFEPDSIVDYVGNYSDYVVWRTARQEAEEDRLLPEVKKPAERQRDKALKFTFKEQREYEEIDAVIAAAEGEMKMLDRQMELAGSDFAQINELTVQRQALSERLEGLLDRWTYLNELAERIASQNK